MKQSNLDFSSDSSQFSIFDSQQIALLNRFQIPVVIKFLLADKFDDKFIESSGLRWVFSYSGSQEVLNFNELDQNEITLCKYYLVSFIQRNTPSGLSKKFNALKNFFSWLKSDRKKLTYDNSKEYLQHLVEKTPDDSPTYYYIKFLIKMFFLEDFPQFDIAKEYELELLERPNTYNSSLYYQEQSDRIDIPTITMLQQGFTKLAQLLQTSPLDVTDETLKCASILGVIYVSGLRPVQLSKLSVDDLKVDTFNKLENFRRYSLLIPYAKQSRYVHEKIAVKLPEEVAEIILTYIKRFDLSFDQKLFELSESAARYCMQVINKQMFEFAPESYKASVLNGDMLQQKYSFSDFRHHVGFSMALSGASAEEIAYILGHSSVVAARHYILSSPDLAEIRAQALGRNSLYQQMIAMLLTGRLVNKNNWSGKKVLGNIREKIIFDIGGCAYKDTCLFQPVRNCYGCMYFHPFIDGDHHSVLMSIQDEINQLVKMSDSLGNSKNPLINIHLSTKFEIESVINRCKMYQENSI